jgi:nucleoside-diphosphate-sugar epimerase
MNLVTGATGLVGSHLLLKLLQQGEPVIAMKRSSSNLKEVEEVFSFYTPDYKTLFNKIIWREADLNDVLGFDELLKDVKTVYHCAALISLEDKDKAQLLKANKEGTANLVNACIYNKIEAFCFVSSIATLQNKDIKSDVDETVFWKTSPDQSAYSLSKYLAEQEVWRGMEEGLNAIIVNPGVIVGPGNWGRGTGQLVSLSYKGVKFYTGGVTGFVGAIDVAGAMVALMNKKIFGERFILVENNYPFKYILDKIHSELGKPLPKIKAGTGLLTLGKWFSFLMPDGQKLTSSTISALTTKTTFSNRKLGRFLDYKYTTIEECLEFASKCYLKRVLPPSSN